MNTTDTRISKYTGLITPAELKERYPCNNDDFISGARSSVERILNREDTRKILLIGPCSVHSIDGALEYALLLKGLSDKVSDKFLVVMRVYPEKPRTIIDWKGLLYDPRMDGSNDINQGIDISRSLLSDLAEMKIPVATEFLGTITPQYIDDIITIGVVGARTTESQPHREMASGLSVPVGFKNSSSGDIDVALNSMESAARPHDFIGMDQYGRVSQVRSTGNPYTFLVLRGGNGKPNYHEDVVAKTASEMQARNLAPNIMIDCSHANSGKDIARVPVIFNDVFDQINRGNENIVALMIESYLSPGSQKMSASQRYDISVTDPCIGWAQTENMVLSKYQSM